MEKNKIDSSVLIFLLLLILFVSTASCRKEESVPAEPVVTLLSPYSRQQYSIFDTIYIHLKVAHTAQIRKISLGVTDQNEKPVLSSVHYDINDANYELKTFIIIDNRYINETLNFLNVKVEDQENIYNYWYEITIHPLGKELNNLLLVTGSGNNNSLYKLDFQGNATKLLDWQSEYLGGYYDSRNRNFYTSGSLIDGLMAYSLTDSIISWEVNTVPGNSLPHFTCFTAATGKVSAAIFEGYIESYNAEGMKIFKSNELSNGYFKKILHYRNFIASVFKNYSGQVNRLLLFNYPAGNIYDSIDLQGEIVDIIPAENMEMFLVLNDEGFIKLWSYNFNQKSLMFKEVITSGEAQSVTGNFDNMFISVGSSVMWYKPASSSNIEYLEFASISTLAFDSLNNTLYVAQQDSLFQYQLPATNPLYRNRLQSTIKDIEFIYNK